MSISRSDKVNGNLTSNQYPPPSENGTIRVWDIEAHWATSLDELCTLVGPRRQTIKSKASGR